jgi:hypothetical protein
MAVPMRPLAGALAFALVACASEPPALEMPPVAPGTAMLVVYRTHADAHAGDYPFVYVDDQKKGALTDAGVVTAELSPGSHRVLLANPALWDGQQYWPLNASPGRRYFYRLRLGEFPDEDSRTSRYLSKALRVDQVAEDVAMPEIQSLAPPP